MFTETIKKNRARKNYNIIILFIYETCYGMIILKLVFILTTSHKFDHGNTWLAVDNNFQSMVEVTTKWKALKRSKELHNQANVQWIQNMLVLSQVYPATGHIHSKFVICSTGISQDTKNMRVLRGVLTYP